MLLLMIDTFLLKHSSINEVFFFFFQVEMRSKNETNQIRKEDQLKMTNGFDLSI